jgi:DNA-binding beta-propeller fold protein YncE
MHSPTVSSLASISLVLCLGCGGDDEDTDVGAETGGTAVVTLGDTSETSGTASSNGGSDTGDSETDAITSLDSTGETGDDDSGTDSAGLDCDGIPRGPFTPELFTDALAGSEDIGFDGKGHLAGKSGSDVLLVDGHGRTTVLASGVSPAYGLRFRHTGDLVVALYQQGTLVQITPEGMVSDWVTGLSTPNGVYPDHQGNVWVTEFGGSRITRVDSNGDTITIAQGGADLASPNGIVWDPDRGLLYYTNYQAQRIRALPIDEQGNVGDPMLVAVLDANGPDGLVLDACGNLYVVAQQSNEIWRVWLDDAGGPVGDPELIASLSSNVANAQFGSGPDFDEQSLYAAGVPGDVWRIEIGVPGAAIPTVP